MGARKYRPTRKRKAQVEAALATLFDRIRRHPEYEQRDTSLPYQEFNRVVHMTLEVQFNKTGREIFVNPHAFDSDYDFPELVGRKVLEGYIRDAARQHGLRLTSRIRPAVAPSEKGWVSVGFRVG